MYEYQLTRDVILGRPEDYEKKLQFLESLAEKENWGNEDKYGEEFPIFCLRCSAGQLIFATDR